MPTFLDRYLNGEHEQVWAELYAQGEAIQQEPLFSDALAVTQETMRRVRTNIETLVQRLHALGYQFGVYPDRRKVPGYSGPYHPPMGNIGQEIAELERLEGIGKLPLSLKVFWQTVGDVDFMGSHPKWPAALDPLVVYPIEGAQYEYDDWLAMLEEGDAEAGLFGVPLAPDNLHKDNVSGGAPYEILVPNAGIDGIVENEGHETTFVNYLRICFRYGGFPGIEWHRGVVPPQLSRLPDGLLPV